MKPTKRNPRKRTPKPRVVDALLREHADAWLAERSRPDPAQQAMLVGELNMARYLPELPELPAPKRRSKAKQ